jgi:hypothetical protein
MLSVGKNTLWNEGRELSYKEIFPFLWENYLKNPTKISVGFYLKYDFLEWTKKLNEREARLLYTTEGIESRKPRKKGFIQSFPVIIDGEWEIDLLPNGKRFKLRPHMHKPTKRGICACGKDLSEMEIETVEYLLEDEINWENITVTPQKKIENRPWLTICDTGSFWQCSFLRAIDPSGWNEPIIDMPTFELIKKGKEDRGKVYEESDTSYYEEMRRYNILENTILAKLTERLADGFKSAGVNLKHDTWFGPGQASSAWLKKNHADQKKRVLHPEFIEKEIHILGQQSYYGGWFEIPMHGHIPGICWEYDINSAYPYALSKMPNFKNGRWVQGTGSKEFTADSIALVKLTVQGSDPYLGALPYRDRHGRILRLQKLKGVYWWHEIQSSINAGLIDNYEIEEWAIFLPNSNTNPFSDMKGLYEQRLKLGKNTSAGKALKLLYNSVYGKFAQSVGAPLWGNSVYASFITSYCRKMITDAISTHPKGSKAVAMVATDGVYFTSEHPSIEIDSERLGAWDVSQKEQLTLFMPGVYWDNKVREVIRNGFSGIFAPIKTRGVNPFDLMDVVQEIDNKFNESYLNYLMLEEYEWPAFSVPIRFDIVSAKQALSRNDWGTCGIIHGDTCNATCPPDCKKGRKYISSNPNNKRNENNVYIEDSIIRTGVYSESEKLESTYYDKKFGFIEDNEEGKYEQITPEGETFYEWFHTQIEN